MSTYSNWREDLIEVIDTPTTEKKAEKKIKETKVNNKVVINPTFKEAVAEMGGHILEVAEVDDKKGSSEDPQIKSKEKRAGQIKRQVLMKKLQAVRAGGGADITAGYEPEGEMVEDYETKKTGEVLAAFKRDPKVRKRFEKAAKKEDGPGSVKNRAADSMLQTAKDTAKRKGDTSKSDDRYAYESAVLDANTKIQKKEQRKKDEKEYAKLMAIYNHQKDLKKRGLSNSHEPEGEVIEEGIMKMVKKVIRSKKPAKKATMDDTTDKLHDWRQKNSDEQKEREKYVSPFRPIVKEADDKAYKYVVSQLKKKYGDGVLTKGDKMPEPSAAQKKKNAEIRAKRAKEDHRDPTEKASDGRYSDRYSNRGSD